MRTSVRPHQVTFNCFDPKPKKEPVQDGRGAARETIIPVNSEELGPMLEARSGISDRALKNFSALEKKRTDPAHADSEEMSF
jgi:hypothetical protein